MSLRSSLVQYRYTVQFHTPAFLGDAEQSGAWRTPPFKALLRQWWRVAFAAGRHAERGLVEDMRRAEAKLFGSAADADSSSKSQIRMRLNSWALGSLDDAKGLKRVKTSNPYLGFGLKGQAAIDPSENHVELKLAFHREFEPGLKTALWLISQYGTLGSRSRNGWGSINLEPLADSPKLEGRLEAGLLHDWQQALKLDWPHAIGLSKDGRPLIWQSQPFSDWGAAMRQLSELKKTICSASKPERHWLNYPVTKQPQRTWDGLKLRLPNSLRFKVRPNAKGQLCGVIFHVPCLPPSEFTPNTTPIGAVWQRVHAHLDATQNLTRIPA